MPRSLPRFIARALGALALAALATGSHTARADGDDRAVAQALVASAATFGPPAVTGAAVTEASDALERATRLRVAGDEPHGRDADGLAREWAETARDLGSASAAEKLADDRKHQAIQARAQLQRTKALVEEGLARLGRLRAELDAASVPTRHAVSAAPLHADARPKKAESPALAGPEPAPTAGAPAAVAPAPSAAAPTASPSHAPSKGNAP
jgi:hypothetical protein